MSTEKTEEEKIKERRKRFNLPEIEDEKKLESNKTLSQGTEQISTQAKLMGENEEILKKRRERFKDQFTENEEDKTKKPLKRRRFRRIGYRNNSNSFRREKRIRGQRRYKNYRNNNNNNNNRYNRKKGNKFRRFRRNGRRFNKKFNRN